MHEQPGANLTGVLIGRYNNWNAKLSSAVRNKRRKMKIHEYQAKEIMRRYGIPVQPGKVATTPREAEQIAWEFGVPVVIKAQVYVGGRGKAGGIQFGDTP